MSDSTPTDQQQMEQPSAALNTPPTPDMEAAKPPVDDQSTIGTGTSMALGCIAGTVVLIGFGLLFLFISTLV